MRTQAFPPPYKGQKDDIPLAGLESPYAERVLNFNLDDAVPTLRFGSAEWVTDITANIFNSFMHIAKYATSMFAFQDNGANTDVYTVTAAGVPVFVYAAVGTGSGFGTTTIFNKYLFFFNGGSNTVAYFNGAWGSPAYTFSANFFPFGGCVYKNRQYMLSYNNSKYCYSEIDAITGATTDVDLSFLTSENTNILGIRAVALSQGIQQQTVLAFVFASGEVLAYDGNYPNSSNWQLIGRFQVAPPIDYHPFIDAKGDTFIITQAGLISLRSLFGQGSDLATSEAISAPITNRWLQIIKAIKGTYSFNYIKGVYDSFNDRMIIFFPSYVNPDTGALTTNTAMRLVYSFKTGSWAEANTSTGSALGFFGGLCFFDNSVYFAPQGFRTDGPNTTPPSKSLLFTFSTPVTINELNIADIDQQVGGWDDSFTFSGITFTSASGVNCTATVNGVTATTSVTASSSLEYAQWLTSTTPITSFKIDYKTVSGTTHAVLWYSMKVSSCNAGSTAPSLTAATLASVCPANKVNLNSLLSSSATAAQATMLKWYTDAAHTTAVADATQAAAGTYYAFYYDATNNCYSPATGAVTATVAACCPTTSPTVN